MGKQGGKARQRRRRTESKRFRPQIDPLDDQPEPKAAQVVDDDGQPPIWWGFGLAVALITLAALAERSAHSQGISSSVAPSDMIAFTVFVVGLASAWRVYQEQYDLKSQSIMSPKAPFELLWKIFRDIDEPGSGRALAMGVIWVLALPFGFTKTPWVVRQYVGATGLRPTNAALLGVAWCALLFAVMATLGAVVARRVPDKPSSTMGWRSRIPASADLAWTLWACVLALGVAGSAPNNQSLNTLASLCVPLSIHFYRNRVRKTGHESE